MSSITHVKEQESGGYQVTWANGTISSVPDGHRFAEQVQQWIAAGNDPDPIETEAERKSRLSGYVKSKRARVMAAGITWNGYPVQTNPESRQNIGDEALAANAGVRPDPDSFRMADNQSVNLSNADMIAMAGAVRDHIKGTYAASWQIAAEIEAGTITSESDIDNHSAWPST